MKITMQRERLIEPVSLRSDWLISRACRPTCESPISPSISARGTSAATESTTSTSIAFEPHQRVDDLERLLASVGLRDDQLVNVDAELPGIDGVERVLGIDEGDRTAALLRFGQHVQRQRGLARAFRSVNLDHPAARQATDAQGDVEPERPGRDRLDLHRFLLAQLHRRALAECAVDLRERGLERLLTVHVGFLLNQLQFRRHDMASVSFLGLHDNSSVGAVRIRFVPIEQEANRKFPTGGNRDR
jgi:hypothetical protein